MNENRILGLLAEFAQAEQLRDGARRAREEGFTVMEAYSPMPVDGLAEIVHTRGTRVSLWMLLGAIGGGGFTYWLEWYSAAVDYPVNVGGRPPFSWPAFIPPALEMTILWAVLAGVAALLIGSRLPMLHHPLFDVAPFDRASSDRFFLLLRAEDPQFNLERTHAFLSALSPLTISEVRE
ncbi:MAG TPA: DUF3341 domain-containing protein [Rhodanobacteraceae bacterium]|nr:DUF3341 domain-containing protein [Rhodanobacteraceae bacterium]